MATVKFGDVVKDVKVNIDRSTDNHEFFIAGEHMDSNEIHIRRRGRFADSDVGPAFIRLFKPGQVLYGSRRTYLKKVAVADFEGITSNTTFVLETKDQSVFMQELLPYLMLTDRFTDFAVRNSKGSTNPYILFKDIAAYEFELPEYTVQQELVTLLTAMDATSEAYKKLLDCTDALVQSQFVEMFGSMVSLDDRWDIRNIGEVTTTQLGKMLNAKNQTGKHMRTYLANRNVQWFSFDFSDLRQMDFDESERKKYALEKGDLLVCEGGEIGRCAVWNGEIEDCYIQNAVHRVRCNRELILPEFLAFVLYQHAQENGFSDIVGSKVTIAHLPADKLKSMQIIVPPMDKQKKFAAFAEQLDKSKFVAGTAVTNTSVCKYKNINSRKIGGNKSCSTSQM